MTSEQLEHLKALTTKPERAAFLLTIGVTTKTNIEELGIVCRAAVGSVMLPVTGDTEEDTIKKGTEWLKQEAALAV